MTGVWGGVSPGDQWRLTDHINQSSTLWLTLSCSLLCLSVCLHISVSRLQDFNNQAHPSFPHITWELLITGNTKECSEAIVDAERLPWTMLPLVYYHHKRQVTFKKNTHSFALSKHKNTFKYQACKKKLGLKSQVFSLSLWEGCFKCHTSVSSIDAPCWMPEDPLSSLHNRVNCVKSVRKVRQQKGSVELELCVL